MKLALYCDGKLKCELELSGYEFGLEQCRDFRGFVEYREKHVRGYVAVLKAECFRQLARAKTWEIFLIAESKLNSDIELYAQEDGVEIPEIKLET